MWGRVLAALQGELAEAGRIDWELWCIDGSHVRAHRVAAGAGGKTARIPMTIFLPALSRLFAFAGAEKARLRATTRTARQIFFWGVCLLSVNWDCLLLRRVRKDFQWCSEADILEIENGAILPGLAGW